MSDALKKSHSATNVLTSYIKEYQVEEKASAQRFRHTSEGQSMKNEKEVALKTMEDLRRQLFKTKQQIKISSGVERERLNNEAISLKGKLRSMEDDFAQFEKSLLKVFDSFRQKDPNFLSGTAKVHQKMYAILDEIALPDARTTTTDQINKLAASIADILEPYFKREKIAPDVKLKIDDKSFIQRKIINQTFSRLTSEPAKTKVYNSLKKDFDEFMIGCNKRPVDIRAMAAFENWLSDQKLLDKSSLIDFLEDKYNP